MKLSRFTKTTLLVFSITALFTSHAKAACPSYIEIANSTSYATVTSFSFTDLSGNVLFSTPLSIPPASSSVRVTDFFYYQYLQSNGSYVGKVGLNTGANTKVTVSWVDLAGTPHSLSSSGHTFLHPWVITPASGVYPDYCADYTFTVSAPF